MRDFFLCSAILKKAVNALDIDLFKIFCVSCCEVLEKEMGVGRICFYTVFCKSPFRDQVVEEQLVECGKRTCKINGLCYLGNAARNDPALMKRK